MSFSADGDGRQGARRRSSTPAGRDLTLTIAGESPMRYFDSAPKVTMRAGNQVLAAAEPSSDFEIGVKMPAAALAAADGMITIETDKTSSPHERRAAPTGGHLASAFSASRFDRVSAQGKEASFQPAC